MSLAIKNINGQTIILDYYSNTTYGDLKQQLVYDWDPTDTVDNYRLIYEGKDLNSNDIVNSEVGRNGYLQFIRRGTNSQRPPPSSCAEVFIFTLTGRTLRIHYPDGITYGRLLKIAVADLARGDNPENYSLVMEGKSVDNHAVVDSKRLTSEERIFLIRRRDKRTLSMPNEWSIIPTPFKHFISSYYEREKMNPKPRPQQFWNSRKPQDKLRILDEYREQHN